MLKIKLLLSEKRYAAVAKELIASGHVIDDNAELLLTERQDHPDCLMAKKDGTLVRLGLAEVTFILSQPDSPRRDAPGLPGLCGIHRQRSG